MNDTEEILEHPHVIVQYTDCKYGLTKTKNEIYKPSHTMSIDLDLVLAYEKVVEESKHIMVQKWVLVHADEKKNDKLSTITPIEREIFNVMRK